MAVSGHSDVAARLRMIRDLLGETQKTMSARLDLGAVTWQRLEKGEHLPSGDTLLRIAALGFSPTWVLTGAGHHHAAEAVPQQGPLSGSAIDAELLGRVTDVIARTYKAIGAALQPVDLGRLAARHYEEIVSASADAGEQAAMLKLLAAQIKRELTAAAAEPGTGKRRA